MKSYNVLTGRQRKLILFFIFLFAVLVSAIIIRYNSFKHQQRLSQTKEELHICLSWKKNLQNIKGNCLASAEKYGYGEKASFYGSSKPLFPAYKMSIENCISDFYVLRKKYSDRTNNSSARTVYLAAEMLEKGDITSHIIDDYLETPEAAPNADSLTATVSSDTAGSIIPGDSAIPEDSAEKIKPDEIASVSPINNDSENEAGAAAGLKANKALTETDEKPISTPVISENGINQPGQLAKTELPDPSAQKKNNANKIKASKESEKIRTLLFIKDIGKDNAILKELYDCKAFNENIEPDISDESKKEYSKEQKR